MSIVTDEIHLVIFGDAKLEINKCQYLLDEPLIQNDDVLIIFLKSPMNKNNYLSYDIEQVHYMLKTRLVKKNSD